MQVIEKNYELVNKDFLSIVSQEVICIQMDIDQLGANKAIIANQQAIVDLLKLLDWCLNDRDATISVISKST